MKDDLPTSNSERTKAIAWLREVLAAIVEIAPISYWQKKKTTRFLNRMPDWLLADWADALKIDYMGGCNRFPDIADKATGDTCKQIAQQYLENHDAVVVGNSLGQISKSFAEQSREGNLSENPEIIRKQVCALAFASCTVEGADFAEKAEHVLSEPNNQNQPFVNYQLALMARDVSKIEALEAALAGDRYGSWVAERVTEFRRYLGLEQPHFTVHSGERTPQWDLLWQRIFTGGDDN
jgi:hypothetical protein